MCSEMYISKVRGRYVLGTWYDTGTKMVRKWYALHSTRYEIGVLEVWYVGYVASTYQVCAWYVRG